MGKGSHPPSEPSPPPDESASTGDTPGAGGVDPKKAQPRPEGGDLGLLGRPTLSPFNRETLAPPEPESEYVARMMLLAASESPPNVPRSIVVPPAGPLPATGGGPPGQEASDLPPTVRGYREDSSSASPADLEPSFGAEEVPTARTRSLPPSPSFGPANGDALELVTVRATSSSPPDQAPDLDKARDRFELGDFSGAMVIAEALLEEAPDNTDALLLVDRCRVVLRQMYLSRLGGLATVPSPAMSPEQLRWLSLDHRSGFVLSLVDGRSSVDEILDVSGMPDIEALRILFDLLRQNVIRFG